METKEKIEEFLSKRPEVKLAFGYGSGVFKQLGYEKENPQIDLILAVENIKDFHLENIEKNPNDYSYTAKRFVKENTSEKIKGYNEITYQSNIKEDGLTFKYGVIEKQDLAHQLITWNHFYMPGRFQKPILTIKSTPAFDSIIKQNRRFAIYTALHLVEDKSYRRDLYEVITSLSYMGDTRMKYFENPNKIRNIVNADVEFYEKNYFKDMEKPLFLGFDGKIEKQEENMKEEAFPAYLAYYLKDVDKNDLEALRNAILTYFRETNKKESMMQTIHGIHTNGVTRSASYVFEKCKKRIQKH